MITIKSTAILIGSILLTVSVFAQRQLKSIADKADNSVFAIVTYDKQGKVLNRGCGFFIDTSGRAISKAHIFLNAYSAKVIFDKERKLKVRKLISLDPISDLALFKVKKSKKSYSYFQSNYVNPVQDEEVLILKNAREKNSKVDLGDIKRVVHIPGFGELAELEHELKEENSGCPVINDKGNLVGVATKDKDSPMSYSLNFQDLSMNVRALRDYTGEKRLPANKRTKFPPLRRFSSVYVSILEGSYANALKELKVHLGEDFVKRSESDKKSLYFLKAFLEKKLNRFDEARQSYTAILEIDMNSGIAYFERAKLKLKMNELESAGKDLEMSVKLAKNDNGAIKKAQGDLFVKLGDFIRADLLYLEAEQGGFNKYEVYKERAKIKMRQKSFVTALEYLNTAIEENPYDAELYILRGEANANLGNKKEANKDFEESSNLSKADLSGMKIVASSNLDMENNEKAIHILESAIKIDPEDAGVLLLRGKAFNQIQSYEEAKTSLDNLIGNDPYLSEAYYQRGKAHLGLNMVNESVSDFTKAIRLDPDYIGPYIDRGVVFGLTGNYLKALDDFEMVVSLDPSNADGHYNKGLALFQVKNLPKACESWRESAKLGHESGKSRLEKFCQ